MTSHHFLTGPGRCIAIVFGLLLLGTTDPAGAASGVASCSKHAAALQVLGSGGPEAGRRSGPGYLLWLGGKARLLIDAGPGTRLRFAESGARLEDLDAIFLTHLHVDHANDLPALVKASYFTGRSRELPVGCPSGNAAMPGNLRWLSALFGSDGYRYLEDHLEPGEGDAFRLAGLESDADAAFPAVLWRSQGIAVTAAGVGHGAIPALAYRIEGAAFPLPSAAIRMATAHRARHWRRWPRESICSSPITPFPNRRLAPPARCICHRPVSAVLRQRPAAAASC